MALLLLWSVCRYGDQLLIFSGKELKGNQRTSMESLVEDVVIYFVAFFNTNPLKIDDYDFFFFLKKKL